MQTPSAVSPAALLASVVIDALHFIASTGQHTAFQAFRRDALAPRPPHVFASFRTREEAEAWLDTQPHRDELLALLRAD